MIAWKKLSVALCLVAMVLSLRDAAAAGEIPNEVRAIIEDRCVHCHCPENQSGGLDLTVLTVEFSSADVFSKWVKVHDRIKAGEMPPAQEPRLEPAQLEMMRDWLQHSLIASERDRYANRGRTPIRRLTRVEYENTMRDLFDLPGLPLQAMLPPDGSVNGFDRNSEALSLSHVNLAKYIEAADYVLDQAIATRPSPPAIQKTRLSLLDRGGQAAYLSMQGDVVLLQNMQADPAYPPAGKLKHIDQGAHEQIGSYETDSSVGVFRREDESVNYYFRGHTTIYPGRYKVRFSVWSFQWDQGRVLAARGIEALRLAAVQLTADGRGGQHPNYTLGYFDAPSLKPTEYEIDLWLNTNEILGCDVASLAPVANYHREGRAMSFTGPGIAVDWLDVEGPVHEVWPPRSHRIIFGDLPIIEFKEESHPHVRPPTRNETRWLGGGKNTHDPVSGLWSVHSDNPLIDAERLLSRFLSKVFRRPVSTETVKRYVDRVAQRLAAGDSFEAAMRASVRTALCSPDFLFHVEPHQAFDNFALASRLSYMLWNTLPDKELRDAAAAGVLQQGDELQNQAERLLRDVRSQRFVHDFVGQWFKLRLIAANDPDRRLYPEFSPYLQDSMAAETRAYFRELLEQNLDIAHIVQSDFAMLNEKLAVHYEIPSVYGSSIRRVALPPDCVRGGFLTQAALLKVTANGTTTSPVPRGAFVMDRILGQPPEPPPASVPAVEPDVRGAVTIREQLDKHRSDAQCASCHAKIDPPGFALESFDVIGGFRNRYRSLENGDQAPRGSIDPFIHIGFKLGPAVDSSGKLPDGRGFQGIRELKNHLAQNRRVLLSNLAQKFLLYGTCREVTFSDREMLAAIVQRTEEKGGGIRTLLFEVIRSSLFNEVAPSRMVPISRPLEIEEVRGAVAQKRLPLPGIVKRPMPSGNSAIIQLPIFGLFQPDRVDDLKRVATAMRTQEDVPTEVKLLEVDFASALATFSYDPDSTHFKGANETQIRERIDNLLKHVSQHTFGILPSSVIADQDLQEVRIAVEGLDCKGCAYGAYRITQAVPGVVRATASFRDGVVVAWIDPGKTNRTALVDAMKSREVTIAESNDKPSK